MSSLAAARADNFYYGPEYNGLKHKSLNKYRNVHALGDRAKKIKEGIIIIRFEIPYKTKCLKCESIIDKGVRFDAEKKCIGKYFSTNIYEFVFDCYQCRNKLCIVTDPKLAQYICSYGLRKIIVEYSNDDINVDLNNNNNCNNDLDITVIDLEEKVKMNNNAIYKLEKLQENQNDNACNNKILSKIYNKNRKTSYDPYGNNSLLRENFRTEKKRQKYIEENKNRNFIIPLVQNNTNIMKNDNKIIQDIDFLSDKFMIQSKIKRATLYASSIFSSARTNKNKSFYKKNYAKNLKLLDLAAKSSKLRTIHEIEKKSKNNTYF